jgi:hypothetical protein
MNEAQTQLDKIDPKLRDAGQHKIGETSKAFRGDEGEDDRTLEF